MRNNVLLLIIKKSVPLLHWRSCDRGVSRAVLTRGQRAEDGLPTPEHGARLLERCVISPTRPRRSARIGSVSRNLFLLFHLQSGCSGYPATARADGSSPDTISPHVTSRHVTSPHAASHSAEGGKVNKARKENCSAGHSTCPWSDIM